MVAASKIHADIICHIFGYLACSDSPLLDDWKFVLPIASVCQSWRAAIKHIVYSYAIIETEIVLPADNNASNMATNDQGVLSTLTNVSLMKQNDFQHIATRLQVIVKFLEETMLFPISIARSVSIPDSECPELLTLKTLLNTEKQNQQNYEHILPECYNAAASVARAVGRQLPAVRTLDITNYSNDSIQTCFFDELIKHYGAQLYHVGGFTTSYLPNIQPATQLRSFSAAVYSSPSEPVPVASRTLRRLELRLSDYSFPWELLRADRSANTVCFEQLERLTIANDVGCFFPTTKDIEYELEFPRLADLTIGDIQLTYKIAQYLLRAPLKRITFKGVLKDALVLCGQPLKNLDKLCMRLYKYQNDEPADDSFVHQLNQLLVNARSVKEVQCMILSSEYYIDLTDIEWPCLTHLELQANIDFAVLITGLSSLTKLISLVVGLYEFRGAKVQNAEAVLRNLRQKYPEAPDSSIELLMIEYKAGCSVSNSFNQALEALRWVLPRLSVFTRPE